MYGFLEDCRTSDTLQHIISNIIELLVANKYCGLISFNILGEFDSINWHTISQIINQFPLPKHLKCLLNAFAF